MEHKETFNLVGKAADDLGLDCYVVGGSVRDMILNRPSKDLDFVVVGSGIEVAKQLALNLKRSPRAVTVFKNFGTARIRGPKDEELEFVGARKESYHRESRNPIVEDGTLEEDLSRRDFTINALAIKVNKEGFGQMIDLFNGRDDLEDRTLRTPLDPDITFSDDPLRMMRAVRFASQLDFKIDDDTFNAITRNASRLEIISRERIADELMKIMRSPVPSTGWWLMHTSGLLKYVLPQLEALNGVEKIAGIGHKDNFDHTMQVLDKVAMKSDNVWLRWAALLHDIAKPVTKHWDSKLGWTFHNHNFIGSKMVPQIFRALKLPLGSEMKYVAKLVELHMRPIALIEDEVTDSAIRRMVAEAGDDVDDLMQLCEADITSKNREKVRKFLDNFALVRQKIIDLNERDRIRNFQPPVSGEEIMHMFNLSPCREVGILKQAVKDAILDGIIHNEYEEAKAFIITRATEMGLNLNPDFK